MLGLHEDNEMKESIIRSELARVNRAHRDALSASLKLGDYVRFRDMYCPANYAGKVARLVAWDDDDGFNCVRAPRNKKACFLIEPHLHALLENCEVYKGRLQEVTPVSEMEVIADAAK